MISIITPVFNAEKYLPQCISSVQKQQFTDWEWYLIDDGSSDNSLSILRTFAEQDKRIKVLTQENNGPASARNKALDLVKGEYVTFIDSDDWMSENALSMIHNVCAQYSPDIVIWNYIKFQDGKYVKARNPIPPDGQLNKEAVKEYELDLIYRMGHQAVQYAPFLWVRAFKTSLIRDHSIRFNEKLRRSEDTLFSITVQRFCKNMFVFANQEFVVYRHNQTSITHSYVPNYMNMVDVIYDDVMYWAKQSDNKEMQLRASYMYVYRSLFVIHEEVRYKSMISALQAIRTIIGSERVDNSLKMIGAKGSATFGRRYDLLYQRKAFILYLLLRLKSKH